MTYSLTKQAGARSSVSMSRTKRNHYNPKDYLRHFADPSDPRKVHRFDKQMGKWIFTNISNVGAWTGFYSDEDEKWLNKEVESPASFGLTKLRANQPIDTDEMHRIALYVELMIKRVPTTRREFLKLGPKELEDMRINVSQLASDLGSTTSVIEEALARLESELSQDDVMTSKIAQYLWTSQEFIDALLGMNWTVLGVRTFDRYLTGDSPVHFDRHHGLMSAESELVFPLSPTVALHGGRRKKSDGKVAFVEASPAQVKEINRRMILGSERFVYSHRELPWVKDFLRNPPRPWNRILI